MSEWSRMWMVLLVVPVGLGGCCRECEAPKPAAPAAEEQQASIDVVAPTVDEEPPVASADEPAAPEPVPTKPDSISEKTWNMPAGIDRSRQVRLELVEKRLVELNDKMITASQSLMEVEKQARSEDPELGKLYDELVKGSMAYRTALEDNALYAAAVEKNNEAMEAYRTLAQEREDLKKEISQ